MWLPPDIVDKTAETAKKYSNYCGLPRKSAQIDSVVLHQTSFSRGSVPDNYLSVHAHFVVLPDGTIVQLHPVEAYIILASSAFNNDAIAIEHAGNFPDEHGHYWEGGTYGRSVLSAQQISGACDLVKYLNQTYGVSFIFAHRQGEFENKRGNCPGPDIWYNVGEWAMRELGMSDGGKGYKEGNGKPDPTQLETATHLSARPSGGLAKHRGGGGVRMGSVHQEAESCGLGGPFVSGHELHNVQNTREGFLPSPI